MSEKIRNPGSACYYFKGKVFGFSCLKEKAGIFLRNIPVYGNFLYLQLTSQTAEKGGWKNVRPRIPAAAGNWAYAAVGEKADCAKTHGYVQCRENAIRRDFEVIGEELPVIAKQGYNGGYFLMDGAGKHQNSLSHEQLECLEKLAVNCTGKDRETVLSIIHEFGPYCERNT